MRQRAALLLFLGLACGLLASCRVNLAEVPLLRLLERRSGLISFTAPDGNVHVIDQAGTGNKAITGDAGSQAETSVMYTAVTWAPDGNHLAFSRFVIHSGDVSEASLYSAGASGRAPVRLFSSRRIVPFYLSWSPDSRRISLLSQVKGESDLELGVSPAGRQEAYTAVDWGAPYYWNWLADSSSVAAHANAQLGSKMGERLSMITLDPVPHRTDMPVQTDLFQAPDISPGRKEHRICHGQRRRVHSARARPRRLRRAHHSHRHGHGLLRIRAGRESRGLPGGIPCAAGAAGNPQHRLLARHAGVHEGDGSSRARILLGPGRTEARAHCRRTLPAERTPCSRPPRISSTSGLWAATRPPRRRGP